MRLFITLNLLINLLGYTCCVAQFNLAWKLQLNKNNIQVYTAKPANASVNAVKAHTVFSVDPNKVLSFLISPTMHVKNLPNCKSSTLLKNMGDTNYYFHQQYDLPWPVADREVVYLFKVKHLPNNCIAITSQSMHNYIPPNKGYIRITQFEAQWKLTTLPLTKTDAHYMALANPAGSIPAWFLNLFMVDGPYTSFKLMHEYFNGN